MTIDNTPSTVYVTNEQHISRSERAPDVPSTGFSYLIFDCPIDWIKRKVLCTERSGPTLQRYREIRE